MTPHDSGARLGTRWGRTSVLILAALLTMVAVLWAAQAQLVSSALVVSQSRTSELASGGLEGSDVGLGMTTTERSTGVGNETDSKYVLRAGLADGKLNGLCLSQTQTVAGATVTLKLSAGDGDPATYEISGKNAVLDVVSLRGQGASGRTGNGINLDGRAMLGVASSDITTLTAPDGTAVANPLDAPTGVGWFGIDADKGNLYNIKADVYNVVIGGPFSLPGLKIDIEPGNSGCKSQTTFPS